MDPYRWFEGRARSWLARQNVRTRRLLGALFSTWLVFHLAAMLLVAFPAPRPISQRALHKAAVQREISAWFERMRVLGLASDRDVFEEDVVHAAESWYRARRAVLAPLRAYLDFVWMRQGWYMFTAPDVAPERLAVWLDQRGKKSRKDERSQRQLVFDAARTQRPDLVSPEFLNHHRIRRAFQLATWSSKDQLERLCSSLRDRIALRDRMAERKPQVRRVYCELLRRSVEHPDRVGAKRPQKVTRRIVREVQP